MNQEQIRKEILNILFMEIYSTDYGVGGCGSATDSLMLFLKPLLKEKYHDGES